MNGRKIIDYALATLSVLCLAGFVWVILAPDSEAQVTPGYIQRAIEPLKKVGTAVEVDSAGTLDISRVVATFGTFSDITITGSCVGCGGGGGGGVSDPITVNGWTPASGTATVTGDESLTHNLTIGNILFATGATTLHNSLLAQGVSEFDSLTTFESTTVFNGKAEFGTGNRGACTPSVIAPGNCSVTVASGLSACVCSYNSTTSQTIPCGVTLSGTTATVHGNNVSTNVFCY